MPLTGQPRYPSQVPRRGPCYEKPFGFFFSMCAHRHQRRQGLWDQETWKR